MAILRLLSARCRMPKMGRDAERRGGERAEHRRHHEDRRNGHVQARGHGTGQHRGKVVRRRPGERLLRATSSPHRLHNTGAWTVSRSPYSELDPRQRARMDRGALAEARATGRRAATRRPVASSVRNSGLTPAGTPCSGDPLGFPRVHFGAAGCYLVTRCRA